MPATLSPWHSLERNQGDIKDLRRLPKQTGARRNREAGTPRHQLTLIEKEVELGRFSGDNRGLEYADCGGSLPSEPISTVRYPIPRKLFLDSEELLASNSLLTPSRRDPMKRTSSAFANATGLDHAQGDYSKPSRHLFAGSFCFELELSFENQVHTEALVPTAKYDN